MLVWRSTHSGAGSPPRVRGEVLRADLQTEHLRITPACAGRRIAARGNHVGGRDHPRVCGEKWQGVVNIFGGLGSPPRVRGEAFVRYFGSQTAGITPACAGRRCCSWICAPRWWDHPRVCGEKKSTQRTPSNAVGSPPRVRGEVDIQETNMVATRITPACAGRSPAFPRPNGAQGDHPRVCGEKRSIDMVAGCHSGSPPRVRGEAVETETIYESPGITPACAGRRLRPSNLQIRCRDHPRVCGEKEPEDVYCHMP